MLEKHCGWGERKGRGRALGEGLGREMNLAELQTMPQNERNSNFSRNGKYLLC